MSTVTYAVHATELRKLRGSMPDWITVSDGASMIGDTVRLTLGWPSCRKAEPWEAVDVAADLARAAAAVAAYPYNGCTLTAE